MKDRFSGHADLYSRFRPNYPTELFAHLAALCAERSRAVDLATGNGQAAVGLAEHFAEVRGLDISQSQLEHARPHPGVHYQRAAAEATGLPDDWADLVTIAQALHWLDFDALWPEVRRILKPGGIIAAWMYELPRIDPAVDRVTDHYYSQVVGPYWDEERRWVDDGYGSVPFPFAELPDPGLELEAMWTEDQLAGYFSSWSATRNYIRAHGADPLEVIRGELAIAWGERGASRPVRWPMRMRIGQAR